jgi:mannose-6-phosphate isomerase-like protein (cupin superfamily)
MRAFRQGGAAVVLDRSKGLSRRRSIGDHASGCDLQQNGEATMSMATRFLRRDPAEVEPWAETCGRIRPLIEEADGAAAEVHHVEIQDARLHYHERTDEFYYVIDGSGTMVLGDEEIELHPGVVVYVPRGVRHKAVGRLTILTVCIPRGVLHDIHELE